MNLVSIYMRYNIYISNERLLILNGEAFCDLWMLFIAGRSRLFTHTQLCICLASTLAPRNCVSILI